MNENNQAQQVWQSQPVEGIRMSADAIRLRAGKFERKIRRRNLRESIASLLVIVGFSYFFATSPEILLRITWGLFIAGMIWVLVALQTKANPKSMPATAIGASSCLDFFRSELEHQRDALKNVWTWYLAPLVPGYIALNVAWFHNFPHSRWVGFVVLDVVFVAIFVGVWKMNQHAARCLQRTIDDLGRSAS